MSCSLPSEEARGAGSVQEHPPQDSRKDLGKKGQHVWSQTWRRSAADGRQRGEGASSVPGGHHLACQATCPASLPDLPGRGPGEPPPQSTCHPDHSPPPEILSVTSPEQAPQATKDLSTWPRFTLPALTRVSPRALSALPQSPSLRSHSPPSSAPERKPRTRKAVGDSGVVSRRSAKHPSVHVAGQWQGGDLCGPTGAPNT